LFFFFSTSQVFGLVLSFLFWPEVSFFLRAFLILPTHLTFGSQSPFEQRWFFSWYFSPPHLPFFLRACFLPAQPFPGLRLGSAWPGFFVPPFVSQAMAGWDPPPSFFFSRSFRGFVNLFPPIRSPLLTVPHGGDQTTLGSLICIEQIFDLFVSHGQTGACFPNSGFSPVFLNCLLVSHLPF